MIALDSTGGWLLLSALAAGGWWAYSRWQAGRWDRALAAAAGEGAACATHPPEEPWSWLYGDKPPPACAHLTQESSAGLVRLWYGRPGRWTGGCHIALTTHPHTRAYPETAVLLNILWPPAREERALMHAQDLIRRLHLEGRDLHSGQVWQGFHILATHPASVEARLPDDLPRTGADAAYEHLWAVFLVYRYSLLLFAPSLDPHRLRDYLRLAAGLTPALNVALGLRKTALH